MRGFPGVWKLPLLRLTSRDGSPSLTLLSLFSSFILCLTSFRRQWAAFLGVWCPLLVIRSCFVEFAQCSSDLSMNLWRRKWSPHPIPLPSSLHILYPSLTDHFVFLLLSFTYIGSNCHDLFPLHTGEQITDWDSLSNSQLVSDFEAQETPICRRQIYDNSEWTLMEIDLSLLNMKPWTSWVFLAQCNLVLVFSHNY